MRYFFVMTWGKTYKIKVLHMQVHVNLQAACCYLESFSFLLQSYLVNSFHFDQFHHKVDWKIRYSYSNSVEGLSATTKVKPYF